MKMSGFEPLENLRSAKATRALLLLSVFLFSASPGLAAGLLPTIEFNHPAPTFNHPAPTTEFNHPAPTLNHPAPTTEFNHPAPTFNHPAPTTELNHPAPMLNYPAHTTAGVPKTRIDELIKQYSKDPAATKEIHIDRELQSQDKDQDSFRHEVTIDAGIPDNFNKNNTNKNNNCKNNSDHDIEFTWNGTNSDDSACKNSGSRF
jgi:hypothetical protein